MNEGLKPGTRMVPDLIEHDHRIARLEDRQAQFASMLDDSIAKLLGRLTRTEERFDAIETRLNHKVRAAPSLVENLKHAFEALRDASKADKVTAFMKRDALHMDAQMTLRNVLISLGVTPEELQ